MSKTRQEKAASVFNDDKEQNQRQLDFSAKLQDLERLKLQESNKYLRKGMIPGGLRLKKIPTTAYSDAFVIGWNQILSICSTKPFPHAAPN